MRKIIFIVSIFLLSLEGCVPKEQIIFKDVKNISMDIDATGKPLLKADVVFFNPNHTKMRLKEVDISLWIDDAQSAEVKQKLDIAIPAQSDFSVPIEAQLVLKETNLLNSVLSFLGGKKYELMFKGFVRVSVHGITLKVPVSQKQELKLSN